MKKEWLDEQTTVAAIEQVSVEDLKEDNRRNGTDRIPEVPFGFVNDRWEALKLQAQEGDEWWSFCSPQETWNQLAGREGFALVRGGEIVDCIITCFS